MSYTNFSRYKSADFVLSHSRFEPFPKSITAPHATTNEYEFVYFCEASSTYYIEDKAFPLGKSSVVIAPPGAIHSYTNVTDAVQDRFHIRINQKLFSSDIINHLPKDLFVINITEDSFLATLFRKIDYYCSSFEDESLLRPILINTVEEIVYNIVLHHKTQSITADYSTNPLFSRVITFIDEHIHENITMEMICKEVFASKSHIHHLFMQRLAKTPKKYILEKKLFLAQTDIRSGVQPSRIYSNYGFDNYSTFYRSYKKTFNRSPSDDFRSRNEVNR